MDRKLTARIDISKASQAGELELGQDVSIMIRGKVTALRGPEESLVPSISSTSSKGSGKGKEEKVTYPGSIELQISKFAVEGSTGFEALMEDD